MSVENFVQEAVTDNEAYAPVQGEAVGITAGGPMDEELLRRSTGQYDQLRSNDDVGIKAGLYGEDLEAALQDPNATLVEYRQPDGQNVYMPLLVPLDNLSWYNTELFQKMYGAETQFYYFAHPLVPEDENSKTLITNACQEKVEAGAIIFTDRFLDRDPSTGSAYLIDQLEQLYGIENVGTGDRQRGAEIFVGQVEFEGVNEVQAGESMYQTYQRAIAEGEVVDNPVNGVSVAEVIDGEDAERIWEIYQKPFEDLGEDHPMHAGFTKDELMEILASPEETKIVNRVDGKISTLCFFVADFDRAPWFNKGYYQNRFAEYYDTGNVLMFPGIVTDENMRGNDYALNTIDLATRLLAKRGSNVMCTFECTEISATYIPKLVEAAIGNSGVGKITGIEQPVAKMDYVAFRKSSSAV